MITKMLTALFSDSIFFEFTDFVRLKRSYGLKGVRNSFDLSGVFSVHNACQNKGKYKTDRDRGSST